MRIIQSFWSKPFTTNADNTNEFSRFVGGWQHPKYAFFSLIYSCLKLREHYNEVHLATDVYGVRLLIEELKIPYTSFDTSLEDLIRVNPRLWAIGKLYTYANQRTNFLHFDNDVFIWKPIDKSLINSNIICQNVEINFPHYRNLFLEISTEYPSLIDIIPEVNPNGDIFAVNAGVIGGEFSFFIDYANNVLKFLNKVDYLKNSCIKNIELSNMVFEQMSLYYQAMQKKKHISPLFDNINPSFNKVINISNVHQHNYIHMVGGAKKNIIACHLLEQRFAVEFPKTYNSTVAWINNNITKVVRINLSERIIIQKKLKLQSLALSPEILKISFVLKNNCWIDTSEDGMILHYYNSIIKEANQTSLGGLDTLLIYTRTPVTLGNIIDIIFQDEEIAKTIDYQILKNKIVDVILKFTIYFDVLKFY